MKRAFIFVALAFLVAGCGSSHQRHQKPTITVTQGEPGHRFLVCASLDCGPYAVTMHWAGIGIAGQTGFYVYAQADQVGDVTTSTYVLHGVDCGSTFDLVVRAHDGSGNLSVPYETTFNAPKCGRVPVNTVLPALSGTAQEGKSLSTTNGTWTGSPTSYDYQWERCNISGANCSDIVGATGQSYVVVTADVGNTVRATVTATNVFGSDDATTGQSGTVSAAGPTPTAAFTWSPTSPDTGQVVAFNGTTSTCSSTPCTYVWTDRGTTLGTGTTLNFTFGAAETKLVTLTVTDALNRTSSVEHDVIVSSPVSSSTWTATGLASYTFQAFCTGDVFMTADPGGSGQSVMEMNVDDGCQTYSGSPPRADMATGRAPSNWPAPPNGWKGLNGETWYAMDTFRLARTNFAQIVDNGTSFFLLDELYGSPYGGTPASPNTKIKSSGGANHFGMMWGGVAHWLSPSAIDTSWHAVIYRVHFSTGSDGSVQAWWDGNPVTFTNGSTTWTGATLVVGNNWDSRVTYQGIAWYNDLYRSKGTITGTMAAYHGAAKIGTTLASVTPNHSPTGP